MSRLHHTKQLISERLSDSAVVQRPGGGKKMEASWPQTHVLPVLWSRLTSCLAKGDSQTWRTRRGRGPRLTSPLSKSPQNLLFLLPLPGKTSQGTLATHGCICVPQVQGLPPPFPPSDGRLRQVLAQQQRPKFLQQGCQQVRPGGPELTGVFSRHPHTRCGQANATDDKRQWPCYLFEPHTQKTVSIRRTEKSKAQPHPSSRRWSQNFRLWSVTWIPSFIFIHSFMFSEQVLCVKHLSEGFVHINLLIFSTTLCGGSSVSPIL